MIARTITRTSIDLAPRQRAVLEFIQQYLREKGYPPTLREIGKHLGIVSNNGVAEHLDALERKGWIRRTRTIARGIVLTDPEAKR